MDFKKHFHLEGRHAFLSPSNYAWLRYDDEKLVSRFFTSQEAALGTRKHKLASELIAMGIKLPANGKTINMYVNDAIGYRMTPELALYYSDNCFGHADAVGFRRNKLRIFDLKNGVSKPGIDQLLAYAALFCLEYGFKPFDIDYDLRFYYQDDVHKFETDPADVAQAIAQIVHCDKIIEQLKLEELS